MIGRRSPWLQAPILLLRFPAILVAVAAAMFTVALSAAAGPLFLSSAGNAALERRVDSVTRSNAGFTVVGAGPVGGRIPHSSIYAVTTAQILFALRDNSLREVVKDIHELGAPLVTVIGSQAEMGTRSAPDRTVQVRPLTRSGALSQVEKVADAGGAGFWITEETASELGVSAGDTVQLSRSDKTTQVRVAGVYRSVPIDPVPAFWSPLASYITPFGTEEIQQPPLALADDDVFWKSDGRLRDQATFQWEFPLQAGRITIEDGKDLAAKLSQLRLTVSRASSAYGLYFSVPTVKTLFPTLFDQAEAAATPLKAPVDTLSLAAELAALTGVAAVGIYWVNRRRVEFLELIARGVRPASSGLRSVVEATLPAALGAAAGWVTVGPIVRSLGPSDLVSARANHAASGAVLRGDAIAVALLGLVVVLRIRQEARPGSDRVRRVVGRAPWEVLLLAVAGVALYELSTRGTAVVSVKGEPTRVDKLLILFPILFVAGGAGLAVRGLRLALARFRGIGRQRSTPVFLALRRLAAASGVALVLVAASALSIGILAYSGAMASSVRASVDAKALTFVGSDVALVVGGGQPTTLSGLSFPSTLVTRIPPAATLAPGKDIVEILGVDPATFAGGAFWDRSFSSSSLEELMAEIGSAEGGEVPVLVLTHGEIPSFPKLVASGVQIPVKVVGSVRAFPGASADRTVVIGDRDVLSETIERAVREENARRKILNQPLVPDPLFASFVELWAKGNPDAILSALRKTDLKVILSKTAEQVRSSPSILALGWTFGFMQMVALAIGSIALIGMVLYLQARRRSREISYALARRMGLSAGSHTLSQALELAGLFSAAFGIGVALAIVAARLTFSRLDPVPAIAPRILLRIPLPLLATTAAALLLASLIGALLAQRGVSRMKVGEVMRLGA